MGRKHPARLRASNYGGRQRYFLTFCVDKRRSAFLDGAAVGLVLREFQQVASTEGVAILAHCFMPDHVHLLVETLRETCELQRVARLMKSKSGFYFKKAMGRSLWQRSYFDRTLRPDERVSDVIRYIFNNPVRAGLVQSPGDYPSLGAMQVATEDGGQ